MVTSIGGVPFSSITYIDGVSINDIASYMGTIITPPLPDYLYVGGSFTTYKSPSYNRIIRTDLAGNVDTTFNMGAGFNNTILTMATQSDGKIIMGGSFAAYSGSNNAGIARLNTNGTKDTTFNMGSGFNGTLYDIKLQSDGKAISVGTFTSYSGSTRNRIVRLNTDGTYDTTFNIGTGLGGIAYAVGIQSDGKIVVGGEFTTYSGSTSNRILRINTNGTLDTTFNVGTGFPAATAVYGIEIQSDDKVLVSHTATSYSGSTVTRFTRLNTNGTVDTTMNPGTINGQVISSKVQSDGKIIIRGGFSSVSGSTINGLARLQSNGNLDTSYAIGSSNPVGSAGATNGLSIDGSGNVYVGGNFTSYSGSVTNRFVKTTNSGSISTSFNTGSIYFNGQTSRGFNNAVWVTMVSESMLYLGGNFTTYDAPPVNYIVKLDNTGSIDTTFNMGDGFNNTVHNIVSQSDGKLIPIGNYTAYSGSSYNRILRLNTNGTRDTTFNPGNGLNFTAYNAAIQSDGKIIVGGTFTTYSGSTNAGLVRINTNGTKDATFNVGIGTTGNVHQIKLQSDEKLIAVGAITAYSGSSRNRIVRVNTNGTLDTTFNIGTGLGSTAYTVDIQSDGKIIVGGAFTTYSGSATNYIVRINTDGTRDTTFNIGTGFNARVNSLKIQSDGSIIAFGGFTTYSGSSSPRIIKLNSNGTKDTTFNPGTGPSPDSINEGYLALSTDINNNIYFGNAFTSYNGNTVGYITKINQLGTYNSAFNPASASFNGTGKGFNTYVTTILNTTT